MSSDNDPDVLDNESSVELNGQLPDDSNEVETNDETVSQEPIVTILNDWITGDALDSARRKQEKTINIEEGQHYFNGPGSVKDPSRHSASQLIQCQRKAYYRNLNAPEETSEATGVFFFGTQIEEEVVEPLLKSIVRDIEVYVVNDLQVGFPVDVGWTRLYFKGYCDPVFVDKNGTPLLVTEVKSTQKQLEKFEEEFDGPRPSHRAQAHVYLEGLSREYDPEIRHAKVIYVHKDTFEFQTFDVQFDEEFWESVIDWAERNTRARYFGKLPDAEPVYGWECRFCDFKNRCGQGSSRFNDVGATGLLPGFTYPREPLVDYLNFHEEAKITPTLAHDYPDLAKEFGAYDWRCVNCEEYIEWDKVEPDSQCPYCGVKSITGPEPVNQFPFGDNENLD